MKRKAAQRILKWPKLIPPERWAVYEPVIAAAQHRELQFAIGGGGAMAFYTGRIRDSKDIDLYVAEQDRGALIQVLEDAGLKDHYDCSPYDRRWIFRGCKDDVIVDVIWAMANQRTRVDKSWVLRGPQGDVQGYRVRVIPPEELIWSKLYVLQRDRCDWPDILNILYAVARQLDWEHLFERLGPDLPLLKALLSVFAWIAPGRAADVPDWVWARMGLAAGSQPESPEEDRRTVELLDSRPWFQFAPEPVWCRG
jgi:hypothetical protein